MAKKTILSTEIEKELVRGLKEIETGDESLSNKDSKVEYFRDVIKLKFKDIFEGNTSIKKKQISGVRKIVKYLPEFLVNNIIISADDISKLSDKITFETSLKIINILREGTEQEDNPKLLKYLGDDGILKDEKKSFYMNKFSEDLITPEDFYSAIPHYIKELVIEKFFRFIEKQNIYSYKGINNLDKYFRFLGEKINFPKVGMKLLLDYYRDIGYIKTEFDEIKNSYKIELTSKGKDTYLGMKDLLEIKGDSEYNELEGELKKRISEMIIKNLQEGRHGVENVIDELREEGIMIRKKDLKELRSEIFQLIASSQGSKTVIEMLNDEIEDVQNYDVFGGIYQFKRKEAGKDGNKIEKTYSIPIKEVDEIFYAYSKYGQNLTQKQVEYKFKISREVWSLLKSRLNLTKDSLPVSPYTLESYEGNPEGLKEFSDKAGDELTRDKFRKAIIDSQTKARDKEFNRMKKILSNTDNFIEHLESYLKGYKSRDLGFSEIKIDGKKLRKDEFISISFGDVHLGKRNNNEVISRIKRMTKMAICYPQKNVCLIGLGDWLEAVVEGGMHPGQIEGMDGPFGFDLIMLFVNLIEEMIITISKAGKEITFYSVGGNHDRMGKKANDDQKRTANLIVLELIKKGLQNLDVKVEAFREKTNTFSYGNFHYIINHGEDGFSSKAKSSPEKILWAYGNQELHNIIKFGHHHSGYIGETKDATIIGTSHLAGKSDFGEKMGFFSETGVTVIEENEDNLPDVSFKRIK